MATYDGGHGQRQPAPRQYGNAPPQHYGQGAPQQYNEYQNGHGYDEYNQGYDQSYNGQNGHYQDQGYGRAPPPKDPYGPGPGRGMPGGRGGPPRSHTADPHRGRPPPQRNHGPGPARGMPNGGQRGGMRPGPYGAHSDPSGKCNRMVCYLALTNGWQVVLQSAPQMVVSP